MRPRSLLRIARWEVATSTGTLDRRTVAVLVLAVLAAGVAAPALVGGSGGLDEGIYRVAVDEDHPYHDAVAERAATRVVEDPARAEIVVRDDRLQVVDSPKGRAAVGELRSAIESYNDRRLGEENDTAAAFPVVVDVVYSEQPGRSAVGGGGGSSDGRTGGSGDTDGGAGDTDGEDGDAGDGGAGSGDGSGGEVGGSGDGSGSDGTGAGGESGDGIGTGGGDESPLPIPDVGGRFGGSQTGTPADISPPFPFGSLVLAFLFVLPMNFVIQAYGSTIMDERINRRGELLLVAPVSRLDVVGGKTLPYIGGIAAVTVAIAALVDGGPLSVLAVLPVGLLFLACTFVGAMFARSFKELTFVTVTISVLLTSYVFVPAIFTDVTPIALISPLTLVVLDLQNASVSAGSVLFSVGPFTLASVVLFALGLGVYREEDMFTQRPVHRKVLDALAAWIHAPWQVAATSGLLIPFVFVLELLAVAMLFALPLAVSLPAIMVLVALIEEVAKSVHVYAAFEHERFERTLPSAALLGVASGTGFFLAEKATHAVQLVGLHELDVGQLTFTPELGAGPVLGFALFLAPLALHCVTAVASAVGARRDGQGYAVGLGVAVLLHAGYNLGVIWLVT